MSTILLINICIFGVEIHSVQCHIYGHTYYTGVRKKYFSENLVYPASIQ